MRTSNFALKGGKLKMQVICYVTPEDKKRVDILQGIQASTGLANVEYFSTTDGLRERLHRNLSQKTVAVVSVATEKDLIDIYFIQYLLSKVLLVLLLPDTERHTVAMGHRLHPCFMCSVNTDVSELIHALKSIAVHGSPPKSIEQFRNPFESIMPNSFPFFEDNHCEHAAA
jgi:hypothetical protein